MDNSHLKTGLFRYIVPFKFDTPYEEAVFMAENRGYKSEVGKTESELYDYIRNGLYLNSNCANTNQMACIMNLETDGGRGIKLPSFILERKLFNNSETIYDSDLIRIEEIDLLLGRTGVGFFCYEIRLGDTALKEKRDDEDNTNRLSDIVLFQNAFKELGRFNKGYELWKIIPNSKKHGFYDDFGGRALKQEKIHEGKLVEPTYFQKITMGEYVSNMLSFLNVSFFSERPLKDYSSSMDDIFPQRDGFKYSYTNREEGKRAEYVPDKALLFSLYSPKLEGVHYDPNEAEKYALYLGSGYKYSYMFGDDVSQSLFKPFKNVIWYANQEGCACVTCPTSENEQFLSGTFASKVKSDYFTLYMKCLFQSFSLLRFAERIHQEYPSKVEDCLKDESGNLENLFSEINIFLTKEMATSVSHVSHQSDFYIYLNEKLHIKDDVASVTAGIETINHIKDKRIEEEEANRDARLQIVLGAVSLLAIFSAVFDAYEFTSLFTEKNLINAFSEHPVAMCFYLVMLLLIAFIGIKALFFTFEAWKTVSPRKRLDKAGNAKKKKGRIE